MNSKWKKCPECGATYVPSYRACPSCVIKATALKRKQKSQVNAS